MDDLRAALAGHVESGEIPGIVALVARGDDVRVACLRAGADAHLLRRRG